LKNLIEPTTPESIPTSVDKLSKIVNIKDYISKLMNQTLKVNTQLEHYILNPTLLNSQDYYLAQEQFSNLFITNATQIDGTYFTLLKTTATDLQNTQNNIIKNMQQNNLALAKKELESEDYKLKTTNFTKMLEQYNKKFNIGSLDNEIVTVKLAVKHAKDVLQNNLTYVITIFFDALLISIVFSILSSRNIIYPLSRLQHEMENINLNDVNNSLNPELLNIKGEVGDLTRSFSNLLTKLASTTKTRNKLVKELAALNETLEYRIHERTAELEKEISFRISLEKQLNEQATKDTLTGLPNRILLLDRMEQSIANAKRNNTYIAVLFIDLDSFKLINDSFGHEVGDQLLKYFAVNCKKYMREADTIARLGGDEFVIILSTASIKESVLLPIVKKLFESFEKPFTIKNKNIHLNVSMSIGISLFPNDADNPASLINCADTAMYDAKKKGKNTFSFYTSEMSEESLRQLTLENDLRDAFKNGELFLQYQPLLDITSKKIVSMEALIRWQHPKLGLIPPLQFIPIAESSGLIQPIGAWLLRSACSQNKSWQDKKLPFIRVSVNISSYQIRHPDFINTVQNILDETGLESQYLELELTENVILNNLHNISKKIFELKKIGVMIDIDNFGAGHSIINYMKQLPIDTIKIDQSFVQEFHSNKKIKTLIEAMLFMSKQLSFKLVAEGVENKDQLDHLMTFFTEIIQGFYFSMPLSAEDAEKILIDFPINHDKD
jgi:diguanylate cyclase (GGDEF)-like protein